MKTIFVFDDSRVTDPDFPMLAIGEDGEGVALIKFDDWTRPYARFVMCIDSATDASGRTGEIVNRDRLQVHAAYDRNFGTDNWIAVWIESPHQDPRCLDALRALHELRDKRAKERSAALVAGLMSVLIPAAEAQPHITH